ncbi:MAG: S41 family peptidase [Leeuwenhoekiella sp.]
MEGYKKKYLPLFLGMAIAIGIGLGSQLNYSGNTGLLSKSNAKKEKLNRLIDYIDYEYVDNVNTDSIVDVTVNSILENLDPHSVYIPPTEMQRISESMKGDFVGIGVSFYTENDTIVVINAIAGGPSDRAGIQGGDRIVSADGTKLTGLNITNDSLVGNLKGKINTVVGLKIKRPGTKKLVDVQVTRDVVPIISIDASYMLTDTLGYIKINRFAESTPEEFQTALQKLKKSGATQIALDLRDNPGGYISAAEQVVDEFLDEDKLILFTKNKTGKIENSFASSGGIFEDAPVYVLVNENSASASEIVAGAIQDNDQGTIIGRRTFGKGLVQREMELGDGSAVRLTIARYYTPTGRSIQRPYDDGNQAYYEEYMNRYKNGEMATQDSIKVDDSLRFTTPKGKIVYGGGGIIPDIFVPRASNYEQESIDYALRSGFLSRFVFSKLEQNRTYYNNLSLKEFNQDLKISDSDIDDFVSYAARREVKIAVKDYRKELKESIKAVMAQQLFGTSLYEQMINKNDDMIKKVISLSRKP